MFGLEREKGQRMQRSAITFIVTSLAIIALLTYVNLEVAPTLPPGLLRPPTPTPNIFATPLVSPTPLGSSNLATPTLAIAPTVTLSGPDSDGVFNDIETPVDDASTTLEAAFTPTPPALIGNCPPEVAIISPPDGVTASGIVTFFGTATAVNFAAYNLEAFGPETGNRWTPLLETLATQQAQDAILGSFDFSQWQSGLYTIRLTVNDVAGGESGTCAIQLTIESPNS